MINERDGDLLAKMLRYPEAAIGLLGPRDPNALAADMGALFAVSYALQIVGEAANRVSGAARSELPTIPWTRVIGMRHRLVHGYEDIRIEVLVGTVRKDLPPLIATLKNALSENRK